MFKPDQEGQMEKQSCLVDGCARKRKARGYCNTHHSYLLRFGTPTPPRRTPSHQRNTREYKAWANAKYRCRTQSAPAWEHYGGRGITFSSEWDAFNAFLLDMGRCPPGGTLDRIDNDRGYEPGNCRWASCKQQSRNTRASVCWTFGGETRPIQEWAERMGCSRQTLHHRVTQYGWSIEKALTTPVRAKSDSRWTRG